SRQRRDQARAGEAISIQPGLLQGLRHLRVRMSLRRDQDDPRDDMTWAMRRPEEMIETPTRNRNDTVAEGHGAAAEPDTEQGHGVHRIRARCAAFARLAAAASVLAGRAGCARAREFSP